jgi:hypothetical protein
MLECELQRLQEGVSSGQLLGFITPSKKGFTGKQPGILLFQTSGRKLKGQ